MMLNLLDRGENLDFVKNRAVKLCSSNRLRKKCGKGTIIRIPEIL